MNKPKKVSPYCYTCKHQDGEVTPCSCCLHMDKWMDNSQWERKDQKTVKKAIKKRKTYTPWTDQIDQAEHVHGWQVDDR